MKLLLISHAGIFGDKYIPLDLGYIKSYCLNLNPKLEIEILTIKENKKRDHYLEKIKSLNPNIIIFATENIYSSIIFAFGYAINLFKYLKKSLPKTKLAIQTYKLDEKTAINLINKYKILDFIFLHEPFITIHEFLSNKPLQDILGLIYREKQEINFLGKRELIDNLDILPSPYISNILKPNDMSYIYTSFGCLFSCYYCFRSKKFSKVRYFSIKRIIEEIKYLRKKGCTLINIIDDCFITKQKRFEELTEEIMKLNQDQKLEFKLMLRPEFLTEKNINLMNKINVKHIQIGIQTINPILLKGMNRSLNLDNLNKSLEKLNSVEIDIQLDIILGIPNDTLSSFKNTFLTLLSLPVTSLQIAQLFLHPVSKLYDDMEKYGITFFFSDDIHTCFLKKSNTFPEEDIKKAIFLIESYKSKTDKKIISYCFKRNH